MENPKPVRELSGNSCRLGNKPAGPVSGLCRKWGQLLIGFGDVSHEHRVVGQSVSTLIADIETGIETIFRGEIRSIRAPKAAYLLWAESEHGGAPKLAGVTLFIIPDNTVRATALETGDLDLIHSPLSPQDVDHLKGVDGVNVSELAERVSDLSWASETVTSEVGRVVSEIV